MALGTSWRRRLWEGEKKRREGFGRAEGEPAPSGWALHLTSPEHEMGRHTILILGIPWDFIKTNLPGCATRAWHSLSIFQIPNILHGRACASAETDHRPGTSFSYVLLKSLAVTMGTFPPLETPTAPCSQKQIWDWT